MTAYGCGVLLEEKDENVSIKFKFGAVFCTALSTGYKSI